VILVDVDVIGFAGFSCMRCFRVEVLLCELEGGEAETLETTEETIERSTGIPLLALRNYGGVDLKLTLFIKLFKCRVQRPPRVKVRKV
jgi:hypothetical protein